MNSKKYKILLDIYKGVLNNQLIEFTTEDYGKCSLQFELLEGKLTPYDLSGCLVRMVIPGQQQDCTVIDALTGKIEITLLQSMFSVSGQLVAELQIYDESNQTLRLTTPRFRYNVRKSLMDDATAQADPAFSILQNMILEVSNANTVANQAKATAESALDTANLAESKATQIMANGDYAKAQGDYAKEQGAKFDKVLTLDGVSQTNFDFKGNAQIIESITISGKDYLLGGSYINIQQEFENGSINSATGATDTSFKNRIKTKNMIHLSDFIIANIKTEYCLNCFLYNKSFGYIKTTGFLEAGKSIDVNYIKTLSETVEYVMFAIKKIDNTIIDYTEKTGFELTVNAINHINRETNISTFNDRSSVHIKDYISSPIPFPTGTCLGKRVEGESDVLQLWIFGISTDDGTNTSYLKRADIDFKTHTIKQHDEIQHNLGHCNSVNYCFETDTIIMGNGSGDYELPNKIYVIENASTRSSMMLSDIIVIDCSEYDFGQKLNVVWGENNFFEHDIAYCILNDTHKYMRIQLGRGANRFEYGQYTDNTSGFNGTFKILNTYETGLYNDTVHDYKNCLQGGTYLDGKLYFGYGHNEGSASVRSVEFINNKIIFDGVKGVRYNKDGTPRASTIGGIATYDDKLIVCSDSCYVIDKF